MQPHVDRCSVASATPNRTPLRWWRLASPQGLLLVSRTVLTDVISKVEGWSASALTTQVRARPQPALTPELLFLSPPHLIMLTLACVVFATRRAQNFGAFARSVAAFAAVGLPAAMVNSGLRFMQKQIELSFQVRLSRRVTATRPPQPGGRRSTQGAPPRRGFRRAVGE